MKNKEAIINRNNQIIKDNFKIFQNFIAAYPQIFACIPPQGATMAYVKLKNGKSAADFCKEIPENTGVLHCRYAGGRTFLSGNAALFAKAEILIK